MNSEDIFTIQNTAQFEAYALEIFNFQLQNCRVYADFVGNLNVDIAEIKTSDQIPFLPI